MDYGYHFVINISLILGLRLGTSETVGVVLKLKYRRNPVINKLDGISKREN